MRLWALWYLYHCSQSHRGSLTSL